MNISAWLHLTPAEKKEHRDTEPIICHRPLSFPLHFRHLFNSFQLDALCLYKLVRLAWTDTRPPVWQHPWTYINREREAEPLCCCMISHFQCTAYCRAFITSHVTVLSVVFPHGWHTIGGNGDNIWEDGEKGPSCWSRGVGGQRRRLRHWNTPG